MKRYLGYLDLNHRRRGRWRSAGVETKTKTEGGAAGFGKGEERGAEGGAGGGGVLGGPRVLHWNSWAPAAAEPGG